MLEPLAVAGVAAGTISGLVVAVGSLTSDRIGWLIAAIVVGAIDVVLGAVVVGASIAMNDPEPGLVAVSVGSTAVATLAEASPGP